MAGHLQEAQEIAVRVQAPEIAGDVRALRGLINQQAIRDIFDLIDMQCRVAVLTKKLDAAIWIWGIKNTAANKKGGEINVQYTQS